MPSTQQQHGLNPNPSFEDDGLGDRASLVGALLRGEKPATVAKSAEPANIETELARETAPTPEGGTQAETPKKAPKDLKELAERLGTEVKDLYELEFPDASGKPHKLGELKDLLAKQDEISAKELDLEERRTTESNNLLRQRREIESLVGMIPKELMKPELIERMRAERERYVQDEVKKLGDVIPEWKDEAVFASDKQGMTAFLGEYGIDPEFLQGMVDHRVIKLVRDSWQRKARIDKAMASVKESREPPKGAQRATGKPIQKISVPSGASDRDKAGAIAQLLRS